MVKDFEITKAPTIVIYDEDRLIRRMEVLTDTQQLEEILVPNYENTKIVS